MAEKILPIHAARHKRSFGRSKRDFPKLSTAEEALIACCAKGEICVIGDGSLPNEATIQNTIRAELIRFLALGGDDSNPVHEEGVIIRGAWIKGKLSLHQAKAAARLSLKYCQFENTPVFTAADLLELALSGSSMPGLRADRAKVAGGVFLNDGFSALGEVRLAGAQIRGLLACRKGCFSNEGKNALIADLMTVEGGVFLSDGFSALGAVRLLGAEIGGNLECANGSFTNEEGDALSADRMTVVGSVFLSDGFSALGEVRLPGAEIGGNVSCSNGHFLNENGNSITADRMNVGGALFLRNAEINGAIYLTSAQVGILADDWGCWQAGGHLLDGFTYGQIIGSTTAKTRIDWLQTQHHHELVTDFAPQPWEQLAKVLREMGHPAEAAQVAIAKQDQWRRATAGSKRDPGERLHRALHFFYGWLAGYGHRPIWTVGWMAGVCVMFSLAFWWGGHAGYFGPTSPLIHASAQFDACGAPGEADKAFWTSAGCPTPPEYTTFQPFFYSLDLILPLVDLHQEADWAPLVVNPTSVLWPGRILRWMMWFEILFGWVASLTLVAVLGRLVDKD